MIEMTTTVKLTERKGIVRIHIYEEDGKTGAGISLPLDQVSPIVLTDLLTKKDLRIDEGTKQKLMSILEGWL